MQLKSETVHAKQSSAQPVLAQENFWVSQNSSRNFITTLEFVLRWLHIRHVKFKSTEDREDSSKLKYDDWPHNSGSEKNVSIGAKSGHERQHCRCLHEISGWTENAIALTATWTTCDGNQRRRMNDD